MNKFNYKLQYSKIRLLNSKSKIPNQDKEIRFDCMTRSITGSITKCILTKV